MSIRSKRIEIETTKKATEGYKDNRASDKRKKHEESKSFNEAMNKKDYTLRG